MSEKTVEKKMNDGGKRSAAPAGKRRRRRGVPGSLVAILTVLALLVGGTLGYLLGGAASGAKELRAKLQQAESDLSEARSTMAMITGTDENTGELIFADDAANGEAMNALSGGDGSDSASALWGEETLDGGETPPEVQSVAVVEFDGGSVMSDQVMEQYSMLMSAYALSGFNSEELSSQVLTDVMQSMASDAVSKVKAEELGLTTLTEEDEAAVALQAQSALDEAVAAYLDPNAADAEADRTRALKELSEAEGVTLETITASLKGEWWRHKLEDSITGSVTVTDEDVRARYDDMVAQQKAEFDASAASYEFALSVGENVVYNLAGYRAVKEIFLALDDAAKEKLTALAAEKDGLTAGTDDQRIAAIDQEIDGLYAEIEAAAKEIRAKLDAGEDFDALIAQYGQDDVMREEPAATKGIYVCQNTEAWPAAFSEAAMALQAVGDVSDLVRTEAGAYLIQYFAQVADGAVPFENVRAQIEKNLLEERTFDAYNLQMDTWMQELHVTYYPERIQ